MTRDALIRSTPQDTPQVERLPASIQGEMNREALQAALGWMIVSPLRERYLKPALAKA